MKSNAVYVDNITLLNFFRVTKEQYDELEINLEKAIYEAREAIKEVTYTYEELFGTQLN